MAEQETDAPLVDLLTKMTLQSIEASGLDERSLMLVRIAALIAVDAPPASYLLNLGAASELGVGEDEVRGVLIAIAPIVGTARISSATGKIVRALGMAIELGELDDE
jgi:alkylhydroperoxidase/carboxymuconolactone decarboxylase family protein YurZ